MEDLTVGRISGGSYRKIGLGRSVGIIIITISIRR